MDQIFAIQRSGGESIFAVHLNNVGGGGATINLVGGDCVQVNTCTGGAITIGRILTPSKTRRVVGVPTIRRVGA